MPKCINSTMFVDRCIIFGVSFKYYILCLRFIAQLYMEMHNRYKKKT